MTEPQLLDVAVAATTAGSMRTTTSQRPATPTAGRRPVRMPLSKPRATGELCPGRSPRRAHFALLRERPRVAHGVSYELRGEHVAE